MVLCVTFRDIKIKINAAWSIYPKWKISGKPVVYQGLTVRLWGQQGATSLNKQKNNMFFISTYRFNGSYNGTIKEEFSFWWYSLFVCLFQLNFHFKTSSNHTFPQPFRCPIPHQLCDEALLPQPPCYIRLAHLGCCWGQCVREAQELFWDTQMTQNTETAGWGEPRC